MALTKKPSKDPASKSSALVTSVVMWAPGDRKIPARGSKRIKRVKNPWTPDDIIVLVKFVCTYQAGKYLLGLIKLWMDYRNAQRIEIKVGDHELKMKAI